jgi:hypothetical protein
VIVHRLSALLAIGLALAAGHVMAAQGLSPEAPFAVMAIPADARAQLNPVVAWDGKGTYLVVWQQGRFYHQGQHADILAARVDSSGRVLDREPIVICSVEASQEQPQVAYSAGRFLVAWHDLRNGRDWDVYAARLTPAGKVLEPDGVLIAGGRQNQASPVLSPAADGFLVVWQHYDRHYQLQAAKLPAAGAPTANRAQPLRFRGEALWGGGLALTQVGSGWLLSWNDEKAWTMSGGASTSTRHFARLAVHNGQVGVQEVQRAPTVHIGRSGGQFASDGESTALYAGWGSMGRGKKTATGAFFGAQRAAALRNPNPEQPGRGSAWNTDQMMTLYGVGVPIDGPVAIAFGQGGYLAAAREAYSGKPSDRNRLLGSRLTAAGMRIDASPWPVLHESPHRLGNPALAGGDRQFLLAFEQEDAAGRRQIWVKILKAE